MLNRTSFRLRTVSLRTLAATSALCLLCLPTAAGQDAAGPDAAATTDVERSPAQLRLRLIDIESRRDASAPAIADITEALQNKDTETRRLAVRTLGRFGRPALGPLILQGLADPAPVVRAEAASALAQNVRAGGDLSLASELLLAQVERESHPLTKGMLALALGRLPYRGPEELQRAEQAIVATIKGPKGDAPGRNRDTPAERLQYAPPLTLLGALRGMEAFVRLQAGVFTPASSTVQLLKDLVVVWRSAVARAEGGPTVEAAARLRRLALQSLLTLKAADATTLSTAFGDGDDQVRRLAAVAAASAEPIDTKLFERAIRDQSPGVRAAALVAFGRRTDPAVCRYVAVILQDPEPIVMMAGLDVAARACAGNQPITATIASIAQRAALPPAEASSESATAARSVGVSFRGTRRTTWQVTASALVALAHLAPDQAGDTLPAFAVDPRPQVRRAAAQAARLVKSEAVLRQLAGDSQPTVAAEARTALEALGISKTDGAQTMSARPDADRPVSSELPTSADLETLNAARLLITVRNVGRFEVRLLPQDAPLHAWAFYRLAREKAFTGATLDLPPAATMARWGTDGNGDRFLAGLAVPPEPGLQYNGRGALAMLHTPGGGPVLYLNATDDPSSDQEATVFGQVERGVEVLDALFPGDVIDRIEVTTRPE